MIQRNPSPIQSGTVVGLNLDQGQRGALRLPIQQAGPLRVAIRHRPELQDLPRLLKYL